VAAALELGGQEVPVPGAVAATVDQDVGAHGLHRTTAGRAVRISDGHDALPIARRGAGRRAALASPATTEADADAHTEVFGEAVRPLFA
jgi:hypothetical protein